MTSVGWCACSPWESYGLRCLWVKNWPQRFWPNPHCTHNQRSSVFSTGGPVQEFPKVGCQGWWPRTSLQMPLVGLLLPTHLSSQIAAAVTSRLTDQTSVISSLGYWPWEEEAVKLLLNFLDTLLDFTETHVKPTSNINTYWKRNRCFRGFFLKRTVTSGLRSKAWVINGSWVVPHCFLNSLKCFLLQVTWLCCCFVLAILYIICCFTILYLFKVSQ